MPESLWDEFVRVASGVAAEERFERTEKTRMRIAHALQSVFERRCNAAGRSACGLWVHVEFDPKLPHPVVCFTSTEYERVPVSVVDEWLQMDGKWHFSNTEFASTSRCVEWCADGLQPGRVRGWDFGKHCTPV